MRNPVARAQRPRQFVVNAVNFTDFNGVVTSPLFGQPNRGFNPRRIELVARLGF
jgi:hypothetical protein